MKRTLLSSKTIYRYTIIMIVLILLFYTGECVVSAMGECKRICSTTENAAKTQVEYRVEQATHLLQALAVQEEYANPDLPYMDKVIKLESINENMGYMMIRYVDADINVYSQRGATSLASREYMQRLFATEEVQVTDSFAAGADGVTLNYTVAVPMYYNGQISGCLFCAIYFDEVQELLSKAARQNGVEVTLLGSQNQMMSATDTLHYGESYMDYIRNARIFGNTKDAIEEDMRSDTTGDGTFWMLKGSDLSFAMYSGVENTNWSIITTISFWYIFAGHLLDGVVTMIVLVLMLLIGAWFLGQYIPSQNAKMQAIVESAKSLERKLYGEEPLDTKDFVNMLRLSSEGLSDNLTGVVTRPVFMTQVQGQMKKLSDESIAALCFVDLDDLKNINDKYGHAAGDMVLKEIGFILREYAKKLDGVVGRYGGDEFAFFFADVKDAETLEKHLKEISDRLSFTMSEIEENVVAHCSMGVAIWNKNISYDMLLNQADKALYSVKHGEKGTYAIYKSGEILDGK